MSNFQKFQKLLEELFQMDRADLDFGIYRIMNQKRDEVVRFLEKDLLPQVKEAFKQYESADKGELQRKLDKLVQQVTDAGLNPDDAPKVQELKQELEDTAVDVTELENDVFSHLFNFFRRYYHEGDFISQRRYKEGVYAIPYEGEEVKLHWANHDQYYIKSSEYFRDYIFTMESGKRVRVHLVAASTEQDNKKEAPGKERRFVIAEKVNDDDPETISEKDGELFIRFEYRPVAGKKKQDALNKEAIERVLNTAGLDEWISELSKPAPTKANPNRTLFEKHLTQYTARNTFDYFIHKDLGGFLRRELDFYIKNEVMHLDDIEEDTVPRVEQYLSKIKVIRKIAHKVILFLEQLENFQKKLWLKKKFILGTNYCITLDRVPARLLAEIAANDAQRQEWVDYFAIDEIERDLTGAGYSVPLTPQFLAELPTLPLDTRHFDKPFRRKLEASLGQLDESVSSNLVRSDSFHAQRLFQRSCRGEFKFFYLDPPYNTGSDDFLYKDDYRYSSWLAMMFDRLASAREMLADDGSVAVSIDQHSLGLLRQLLDRVFGTENLLSTITVKRATVSGPKVINPGVVNISDYVLLYAKDRSTWVGNSVFSERDRDSRYNTFIENRDGSPETWVFCSLLEAFSEHVGIPKTMLRNELGETFEELIHEFVKERARSVSQLCLVRPSNVSAEYRERLKESTASPEKVFVLEREGLPVSYLKNGKLILFYSEKVKKIGERLATAERASDIWTDVLPNDVHNEGGVELKKGKKPESLISRLVALASDEGDLVGDFFLGSGTLAAVAQKMGREWWGVEMAQYFESKPLARMKRVLFGDKKGVSAEFGWTGGGAFRYLQLESYEDTVDGLRIADSEKQGSLLRDIADVREQYILSYMLDSESRGSGSLLDTEAFSEPDEYLLRAERAGETQLVSVDLVETFNRLLGLTVRHIDIIRGIQVIGGVNPDADRVLVLWRNVDEIDNEALETWFHKQDYNTRDQEYDLIYVNGDNNLENLRKDEDTWKVRLIEEEFGRLMFDVEDV